MSHSQKLYEIVHFSDQATAEQSNDSQSAVIEDKLWVDRYRPRKFMELIGNDKVARDALSWIKQWDYCVFGKTRGKKRAKDADENAIQDQYCRPNEKVLVVRYFSYHNF